jgi:type I restriction enzyme S subunit
MKKYSKYKDSNFFLLGDIPSDWFCTSLKRLTEVKDGTHDTPSYIDDKENGVPFITSKDVFDGSVSFDECKYISYTDYININKRSNVTKGDLIMPMIGSIGSPVVVESERNFSIKNLALIKGNKSINIKFVKYYLESETTINQLKLLTSGGVQNFISLGDLRNFKIVKPTLEEQTQIAAYLDYKTNQIETLISNKQKLIELLHEERIAIVNQAVTKGINPKTKLKPSGIDWLGEVPEHWTVSKVGYVSKVIRGASPRPAGDPLLFNGDFMPWITVKEVTNASGKFITSTETFLTELGSQQTRIIEPETLILSNSGATLGVPRITLIKGAINDGSVAFLNLSIEREFLYYFFETHTKIYRDEASGYGQPNLNTEIVKSTPIPIPPLNEQKRIIELIESEQKRIDTIIFKTEQEIELMKEYKTALISEVVTGKVDVRDEVIG